MTLGETVWQRQISKPTGIGGIQGGAAVADGIIYVAGFEGIDDAFSDAQFGVSLDTGLFANAFFATFSPAFWADVEDTRPDDDPATGMRIKVYALNTENGESLWHFPDGKDYVELLAGASMRHVSVANGLLFVASTSGRLFVLDVRNGEVLFTDQTPDLNEVFGLGLGKPHHASMNAGSLIHDGMVYVPYGAQNIPAGGIIAYEVNHCPRAANDTVKVSGEEPVIIDALANDSDRNGDRLRFIIVAGQYVDPDDGQADTVRLSYGKVEVFNPGDDADQPDAAYLKFTPSERSSRFPTVHLPDRRHRSESGGQRQGARRARTNPPPAHRPGPRPPDREVTVRAIMARVRDQWQYIGFGDGHGARAGAGAVAV